MTDLSRYETAQTPIIATVMAELAHGQKQTHWMWFVFPQLRGLGTSERAVHYGLSGLEEAQAFGAHPVLGPRLRAAAELVMSHAGRQSAEAIVGPVDALKLRSSASLFASAAPDAPVFATLLRAFFEGRPCPKTQGMLT